MNIIGGDAILTTSTIRKTKFNFVFGLLYGLSVFFGGLTLLLLTSKFAFSKTAAEVHYGRYLEPALDKSFIQPSDIQAAIKKFQASQQLVASKIGQSFEGRDIYQFQIGNGPTQVMFWSQMHGDEPTATASIFDVLNYILAAEQDSWRASWQDKLTLTFVPMLNPDGSHTTSRFNAMGIDVNRDADVLQTPEGKLLMSLVKKIKLDYGFNLHDQSRNYRVSGTQNPATISVLAPSYNHQRNINPVRLDAMKLLVEVTRDIQARLAGHIARYDDSYSKRAFGDTLTRMGVRTLLFEAGGYPGDDNRQVARKAIYQMMLSAIDSIVTQSYQKNSLEDYLAIPDNEEGGFKDLIVRNLKVYPQSVKGENSKSMDTGLSSFAPYDVDLVIDLKVYSDNHATIKEIGDADFLSAYHELDASGFHYFRGEGYVLSNEEVLTLTDSQYFRLLKRGISHFVGDKSLLIVKTKFPVSIIPPASAANKEKKARKVDIPRLGEKATFLLHDGRGVKFAVINGQVVDLRTGLVKNPKGT